MSKLVQLILRNAVACFVLLSIAACSGSDGEEKRYSVNSSGRPDPVTMSKNKEKPEWVEPKGEVERKALKLRRGATAHVVVTAATFDGAGMVMAVREELVDAIQATELFGKINTDGNYGHFAVDVVIEDTREDDSLLSGIFSNGARLKVSLTVTDTERRKRLSPRDPANLFYGSGREISEQIATYLAG